METSYKFTSLDNMIKLYHHENLLEPAHSPEVPWGLVVDAVGIATNEVLGQDHDEALELRKRLVLCLKKERKKFHTIVNGSIQC